MGSRGRPRSVEHEVIGEAASLSLASEATPPSCERERFVALAALTIDLTRDIMPPHS